MFLLLLAVVGGVLHGHVRDTVCGRKCDGQHRREGVQETHPGAWQHHRCHGHAQRVPGKRTQQHCLPQEQRTRGLTSSCCCLLLLFFFLCVCTILEGLIGGLGKNG